MQQLHSGLLAMQKPTLLKALLQGPLLSVLALHYLQVGNTLPKYCKTLTFLWITQNIYYYYSDSLNDNCHPKTYFRV